VFISKGKIDFEI